MPKNVEGPGVVMARSGGNNRDRSDRDRLAEGEAMLQDRSYGMSLVQMIDKYGYSKPTIVSRIDMAISARIATTVDHYREQQNATLDDLVQRQSKALDAASVLLEQALQEDNMVMLEQALSVQGLATDRLLRLMERRAKLNGTDRPVQVDVSVTETTQEDQELAAMIRDAKVKAADAKLL